MLLGHSGWITVQGKGSLSRDPGEQWPQLDSLWDRVDLPILGPVTQPCAWVVLGCLDVWSVDPASACPDG